MLVSDLVERMSYEEFLGWMSYLERRPIDWRDDDRCSKLLAAQGVKEKPYQLFPSLKAVHQRSIVNAEGTDIGSLRTSPIFQKMVMAVGGDKLEL